MPPGASPRVNTVVVQESDMCTCTVSGGWSCPLGGIPPATSYAGCCGGKGCKICSAVGCEAERRSFSPGFPLASWYEEREGEFSMEKLWAGALKRGILVSVSQMN